MQRSPPNTGFVAVAAGYSHHGLGLKADGSIVAWGGNGSGQCNVPSPNTGFTAVAAGWYHSLGLKSDGSIKAWGSYPGTPPFVNTGFIGVSAGYGHSLALRHVPAGHHPPAQPTNIAPANGATSVSLTPILQSSPFSDPDADDTHVGSEWQLRVFGSSEDYSRDTQLHGRFNSGGAAPTSCVVTITLAPNMTYFWRARYCDNHGWWSDWSAETSFTTVAAPSPTPTPTPHPSPSRPTGRSF